MIKKFFRSRVTYYRCGICGFTCDSRGDQWVHYNEEHIIPYEPVLMFYYVCSCGFRSNPYLDQEGQWIEFREHEHFAATD